MAVHFRSQEIAGNIQYQNYGISLTELVHALPPCKFLLEQNYRLSEALLK